MSYRGPAPSREISESLADFLAGAARLLLWLGLLLTAVGAGLLVYTAMVFGGATPPANPASALTNIAIYDKLLLGGVIGLGVGATYLFWGESVNEALLIMASGAFYFSPFILSGSSTTPVSQTALAGLSQGGMVLGLLSIVVIVVDLTMRAKMRMRQGMKLDQFRYGKGIKEEADRKNVFLGKCWQLPFCRKFVRERCPIYHSRRTCWKELTGCMCEEEVIRNAMENKPIPKDALLAAKLIPRNFKLSTEQKRERCRSCVIYNEHQKHKYRASLPAIVVGFGVVYVVMHGPLIAIMGGIIGGLDSLVGKATFRGDRAAQLPMGGTFQELLLVCFMIIGLAYATKVLEYVIFKLKA